MNAELSTQESGGVGVRLRTARRSAGLTQKQLAEALGVESITVSRWERGVTTPSLPRLRRIAEITETTVSDLVRAPDAATGACRRARGAQGRACRDAGAGGSSCPDSRPASSASIRAGSAVERRESPDVQLSRWVMKTVRSGPAGTALILDSAPA